jgi:diaminohydroxyphosphoribosylaminopyrimidine deaminase/5-amino-6-(5-phosphoribosylamino)uracil reductase
MNPPAASLCVDGQFMDQALALAALGEGLTSPNPRVGCLLVRDGQVVGAGYHGHFGGAHAEVRAVEAAGDAARGATAYVNLEPCAHSGHTPPCVDRLISAGIGKVVASLQDPNPKVDGRGIDKLKAAGIEVQVGLRAAAAEKLNAGFLSAHRRSRPVVTLKAALSVDGCISAAQGNSRWISGEPARRFAHRLRLNHDAVLVGAGTLRRDDPRLTVRLPGVEVHRLRVVLARKLDFDPRSKLFDGDPVRIYTAASPAEAAGWSGRADVVSLAAPDGTLDLAAMLTDLSAQGIHSLLVEGGGRTIGRFMRAGLADRVALFSCDRLIGARGATPLIDAAAVFEPSRGWRLSAVQQLALGRDRLLLADVDYGHRGA